jgi:8-hydroxy-5-deazaflavin:NADPH oxidoreductase
MQIGMLGTGVVGRTLAEGFAFTGHDVMIGTRDVEALMARSEPDDRGTPSFTTWHEDHEAIQVGTFARTGEHAQLLVNATAGNGSVDALSAAGAGDVDGRIVIDASNPLDFSAGFPPSLFVGNTDSLAEQIQRAFPATRVVKAFNTMTAALMTAPTALADGDHTIPICGNDDDAKHDVTVLLRAFGWNDVFDIGDLTGARAMEAYVTLWVRMYSALGTPMVNTKIVR